MTRKPSRAALERALAEAIPLVWGHRCGITSGREEAKRWFLDNAAVIKSVNPKVGTAGSYPKAFEDS